MPSSSQGRRVRVPSPLPWPMCNTFAATIAMTAIRAVSVPTAGRSLRWRTPDLHLVFPVNKQGKKSGEVMRSDEFLPLFRAIFGENGGYFSAQDWYERLDLGKTLKGMIAAREADEIIRKLSFKSFEADYKTMLIWLPEAMNEEAANKILKILEEPWEKTLFLLVSEQPDRLLPTILSRTQEVAVPRIAPDVLERVARERGIADPVKARNMARLAGGDLLELKHLVAGESDALRKENFDLFCGLMRLSYNDKHLELRRLGRRCRTAFARTAACFSAGCRAPLARELHAPCGHQ